MSTETEGDRLTVGLRLAQNWARHYWRPGHAPDLEDLTGAARLGVARALGRYRTGGGSAWASFCTAAIRWECLHELARWDGPEEPSLDAPGLSCALGESVVGECASFAELLPAPDDTEGAALGLIEARELELRIAALEEPARSIVWLHAVEGMEVGQVAETLGKSRQNVWNIMDRARRALRAGAGRRDE